MNQMKNTKGITLIALVITIIVLLILAGVAIVSLTGENGVLTRASKSKTETEIAEVIEKARVDILGVQAEKEGKITEEEVDSILQPKYGTLSGEGKEKTLTTSKGYVIKVSEIWRGTTSGGETEKKLAKDVLKTDATATEAAAISPYVKYNGLDCRVLYSDDTHGIQIITSKSVEQIELGYNDTMVTADDFSYEGTATIDDNFKKAAASYNNLVNNLNNKAKFYMDTKGRAIDARSLGSISTLASSSKFQDDTSKMWSGTYTYLETYSWNNVFKDNDSNYLEDVKQVNDLGLNVSSGYIWLASRNVEHASSYLYCNVNTMRYDGYVEYPPLDYLVALANGGTTYSNNTPKRGFRPIFLIPSNTVISGGDGSSGSPYIIE
ncbi:MAG: type II secretion system protein [Clostridia bacterium]|nr:type II secretion system protein [Clostridia bacterium]